MADILFNSYSLNPLMRNVLITNNEVLFHAATKQTMDIRLIQQHIIIAEERFIRTALGNALYTAMVNTKNVTITSGNIDAYQQLFTNGIVLREGNIVNSYKLMPLEYQQLWLDILWKLVSECVTLLALPESWVQLGAEGVIHSAPPKSPFETSGMASPDLASVKFLMDKKQMDRIDPLLNALQYYLCGNKAAYPLYKGCPQDPTEEPQQKRSDIVLGIYDDNDRRKGCFREERNYDY